MTSDFGAAMRQALRLTRSQKLSEATSVIQRALSGRAAPKPANDEPPASALLLDPPRSPPTEDPAPAAKKDAPAARTRRPLGEVLTLLREANPSGLARKSPLAPKRRRAPRVPVADGAVYLDRTYASTEGSRRYAVYAPKDAPGRMRPLVVMLHGCQQNADDFAIGAGMNRLADELGFIVAYPEQAASANPNVCWNWFNPMDQARDVGEPSLIAGLTRAVTAEFGVDETQAYVAGLSAGGAMAAIMSAVYPDLYAAAGVHSGLPFGSANDVPSAFAAMRGGPSKAPAKKPRIKGVRTRVRTIVFHGASDRTVDPSNADALLADARAGVAGLVHETRLDGIAGGRAYTRTLVTDARGVPHAEYWAVEGLGHAWSGGSPDGSFTDPRGPDASREMVRFFLAAGARPPIV